MRRWLLLLPLLGVLLVPAATQAFCGFYVARADTQLFNKASQVVLVRDEDRTVLTMANDFKGEKIDEFAIVIPVPTFIEREQIHVANKALIDHLTPIRRHGWWNTLIPIPVRWWSTKKPYLPPRRSQRPGQIGNAPKASG
jgi:hypothetical protein